jgi:hypothetical protein
MGDDGDMVDGGTLVGVHVPGKQLHHDVPAE